MHTFTLEPRVREQNSHHANGSIQLARVLMRFAVNSYGMTGWCSRRNRHLSKLSRISPNWAELVRIGRIGPKRPESRDCARVC